MIVKAVTLFLIGMAVLAMFGRLRLPRVMKPPRIGKAKRCPNCGASLPKGVDCPCENGKS